MPNEEKRLLTKLDEDFISNAQIQSKEQNVPIISLISKAIAVPFIVKEAGLIKVLIDINNETYVGGIFNIKKIP